ncbi:MAG: hypothetical protein GEU79_11630 [Acidimicrobiia bacterium]|nr:hypothetical protein [Acidimicrobiia bacterium]
METEQMTGSRSVAEVMVDYLVRAGVTDVFGVAGSTIMPLLDGIVTDGRIDYHGARYELSAAEMASGYARVSSRLGVVMTHCGPGATSCLTAMVGAARDGVPLLLITGNEESGTLAQHPYHDWDLIRVMGSITRFSFQITRPDQLPHIMRRAVGEATRGITQPVHIDLPEDIALEIVPEETARGWLDDIDPLLKSVSQAPALPLSRPAPSAIEMDRMEKLLTEAQKPLIILGETVQWSPDPGEIVRQCRELGIPYVTSFGARGGIVDDTGFAGTIGRFGSRDSNDLLCEADLVLALGAELTDVDTVRWSLIESDATVIAVHPDPAKVDRRIATTMGVVADVGEFLRTLTTRMSKQEDFVSSNWIDRASRVDRRNGPIGNPAASQDPSIDSLLVSNIIEAAPDDWVVTMDPGFGALTLSAAADFGGTRFLYPYGLGAMGFAVPNAIGATISDMIGGAIAIVGDGSFFMSLSSLESIASLDVPVVVVVLDDGGFGSQRKKQLEGYGRNFGVDYENPDIAAIARAMGIQAQWIETPDDVSRLCKSLTDYKSGYVAAVQRAREQEGKWYEGSRQRR